MVSYRLWRLAADGHYSNHMAAAPERPEGRTIDYIFKTLDISWWYYAIAVILAVVVGWKWRWEGGLLAGYAFLILAETVMIRKPFNGQHFHLEPLWSWRVWNVQREQILTNIVMFIPIGILTGKMWRWKGLLFAAGLSIVIEVLQLLTARGLCEFDDVIHNLFGAVIGVGLVMVAGKKIR